MASTRLAYTILVSGVLIILSGSCAPLQKDEDKSQVLDLGKEKEKISKLLGSEHPSYESVFSATQPLRSSLTKSKEINEFQFIAEYQPHLLLAVSNSNSLSANKPLDKKVICSAEDYKDLHYIKFSIENKDFHSELLRYDLKSTQEYSDRIMYYSFYSNKDTYLIENGQDTIKNAFVHFERTFDVSPKLNMTFVFERKATTALSTLNFVFEDVIFNHGRLNFEFDGSTVSLLNASEIKKLML